MLLVVVLVDVVELLDVGVLELVNVADDEVPEADWMAVWTAWRSDWIWLTCVEFRPRLVRMAASSVWMAVVASVPVKVPFRIDSRSS